MLPIAPSVNLSQHLSKTIFCLVGRASIRRAAGIVALTVIAGLTLAQQAAAQTSRNAPMRVGSQRSFWVIGTTADAFDRVTATLVHDGRFSRIWVDNRDTA